MNSKFSLGSKLKAIRGERGMTQRELAKRAGVSANAISLIERDENSPSVATLQSLAGALNVKMSYFFEEDGQSNLVHIKKDERPAIDSRGTRIEGLGERLKGQEVQPFYVSLEPGAGSGERQVVHTGHEFVYCVHGRVEYVIDGQSHLLEEGDFLIFEAGAPHYWRNLGETKAEFLIILQTPNESSEPVERHFSNYPSLSHMG
jgi:transcriptional regulator with XRE-family HTH domain